MASVQPLRRGSFFGLGLGLMLVPTSPAFAGIFGFSVNQAATLAPSRLQATVRGTVACPSGETISIGVQVTQIAPSGQQVVNASGSTPNPISCTTAGVAWTVTANSSVPMQSGFAAA